MLFRSGCVGGMCENMDAYPRPGKSWPKITGTYLQAWSNSEHLRIWYQHFLGIKPDMINDDLYIAPQIPQDINKLNYKFFIEKGFVEASFDRSKNSRYTYEFQDLNTNLHLHISPHETINIEVSARDKITVSKNGVELIVEHRSKGKTTTWLVPVSPKAEKFKKSADRFFNGVKFCQPIDISNHQVLEQKYERK